MTSINPLANLHYLSSAYSGKSQYGYLHPRQSAQPNVEIPRPTEVTPSSHCEILLAIYDAVICLKSKVVQSNCLDRTFTVINKLSYFDPNLSKRRAFKWDRFIAKAVVRFGEWWRSIDDDTMLDKDNLPPLDVLMVWIAYMSHAEAYRRDCHASGKSKFWSSGLPWSAINSAIDLKTSTYNSGSTIFPDLLTQLMDFKSFTPEELTSMAIDQPTTFTAPANPPGVGVDLYHTTRHQDLFVEKICHLLWLRSPYFSDTMARARERWDKFLELGEEGMVPTVDIELVWRANLCVPELYYKIPMSDSMRGRARVSERVLKRDTEETGKVWYEKYVEVYERCLCWDCEALLTAQEDGITAGETLEETVQRLSDMVTIYRGKERFRRIEITKNSRKTS